MKIGMKFIILRYEENKLRYRNKNPLRAALIDSTFCTAIL
jgi:hypothetical protein